MTVQYSVGKTNCLTALPNSFGLSLNSGNLILSKNSIVYVPNGFEEDGVTPSFKKVNIGKNNITADTSTYTGFYCYGNNGAGWLTVLTSTVASETEPTTKTSLMGWYDLSTNRIKRWHAEQGWQENDFSLPLCYCTSSGGQLGINQEFKAFSYVGGQVFALPGVKGLIPNGYNEDGTYKNIEFNLDKVLRGNTDFANDKINYGVINLESDGSLTFCRSLKSATSYNEETNLIYREDGLFPNSTIVIETEGSANTLTSFIPVDVKTTNDLKNIGIKYGVGKTNCLTELPKDIKLELDSLNAQVIGAPVIEDGVVSNFGASNYLILRDSFVPNGNWEMVFYFDLTEIENRDNNIIGGHGLFINVQKNGQISLSLHDGESYITKSGTHGNTVLTTGVKYAIKMEFDGTKYVLSLSTNGGDFIEEIVVESTATLTNSSNNFKLGRYSSGSSYLTGSMDLTKSYIKLNGEYWWQIGSGNLVLKAGSKVYIPNGFEEDGTTPKFDELVIENDLVQGNWGTYSVDNIYVGVTIDGNIWIGDNNAIMYNPDNNTIMQNDTYQSSFPLALVTYNNGVISSIDQIFNDFGYIGTTLFVLPGVKGLIPNGYNEDGTYKNIEGVVNNVIIRSNPNVGAKNLCLYYDENGNASSIGFGIYDDTISTLSERDSTWTSGHYVYVKDENERYVNLNTTPSNMVVYANMTIDSATNKVTSLTPYEVKETNDAIDIKEVHYGVGKTNCLTELPNDINLELDPLNVTVVGTPTNSNGVVSGFSTSSYIKTNEIPPFDKALSFEIVIKFTINSLSGLQGFAGMLTGENVQCNYYISSANKLCSDGIYGNLEGLTALTIGQTYWSKLSYDGSKYDLLLSTNGIDYNLESSVTTNSKITTVSNFAFGVDRNANTGNNHSIDLKESYIKINDEYWWRGGTGHATLKSGSKVYIPNGFEVDGTTKKFDEVVIESDLIRESSKDTTGDYLIFYYPEENKISSIKIEETSSGASYPTSTTEKSWVYYNTTENKIFYTGTSGTDWTRQYGFPVAIVEADVLSFIKIKQIFNGIGYIGSHYFMTTGVKCLEPDGWNEDGTYKVNERQSSNVYVSAEQTGDVTNRAICLTYNNDKLLPEWKDNYQTIQSKDLIVVSDTYYIIDENKIYSRYRGLYLTTTKVGSYQVTSGKITNFKVDDIKTTNDTKIMY